MIRRLVLPALGVLALMGAGCTPMDGGGGTATTTTTTIDPGPPVAIASATPTIGDAPLSVSFDSSGSTPGTGTGLTYSWNFGDGSAVDTTNAPTHIYNTVGTYSAVLTLANSAGTSVSSAIGITVNQDPNPKFYARTTGSTGAACGPLANPCSTITEAQTNAVANGIKLIRVAGGSFSTPLSLVSNMEIVGGYKQDFSDFGSTEVTTIFGTGTSPALTVNGASNAKISGVSLQGVARTSGDAVGVLVTGGSTSVTIGDVNSPQTLVSGGTGPNATGVLITGGSQVNIENTKVNSGTTVGSGSSAYGVRALGLSVVNVTLSDITAQPGIAGVSAPAGAPGQAAAGCGGGGGGGGVAGASLGADSQMTNTLTEDTQKKKAVHIEIHGNYLETEQTRRQLIEMVRQETDATAFNINGVRA